MRNIYLQLSKPDGISSPVLATVIKTTGSTPQKPGSTALFSGSKLIAGTVGGGAVEGKINEEAAARSMTRKSALLSFNLVTDLSRKEEAICGGQITILVDADPLRNAGVFSRMERSLSQNQGGVLLTRIIRSANTIVTVDRYWLTKDSRELPAGLGQAERNVSELLESGNPRDFRDIEIIDESGRSLLFFEPVFLPQRLVIAGAGHIGRVLSHLGKMAGFNVTVIDDRIEFANKANLPDADIVTAKNISEAFGELRKGCDAYIVIVTRGHKDDSEALKLCINEETAYLGMIGSRKKVEALREEFIANKWTTTENWNRVYTPIGLDINAQTVEEIAISIMAQIIRVKNGSKKKRSSCPA